MAMPSVPLTMTEEAEHLNEGVSYRFIIDQIRSDIAEGRLNAGDRMASTRDLAKKFGVSYVTVHRAIRELSRQGLLRTKPRSGTFVVGLVDRSNAIAILQKLPQTGPIGGFEKIAREALIHSVATHSADPRLFEADLFFADVHEVARRDPWSMFYTDWQGDGKLRSAIAKLYSKDGVETLPTQIAITSTQQMLSLSLNSCIAGTEGVAFEAPYALWAAQELGGRYPDCDWLHCWRGELDLNEVERVFSKRKRLVIVAPSGCFAGGTPWSLDHRKEVLRLAAKHQCTILERSGPSRFCYEPNPAPSLYELDEAGCVWNLESTTHILAPGIGVSWLRTPNGTCADLNVKSDQTLIWACGPIAQALARMITKGRFHDHIRRNSKIYFERMNTLRNSILSACPAIKELPRPANGLSMFIELPHEVDSDAIYRASIEKGIAVIPGEYLGPNGSGRQFVRIIYAFTTPTEAPAVGRKIGRVLKDFIFE